jgi:hypothetical protein
MFKTLDLGKETMLGKVFTYKVTLQNLKLGAGLGMTVAILRVPSCLIINFDFLEGIKRNGIVDFYEVRNKNTEIVLYWRQMAPGEVKTFTIDLIQRYNGGCMQKPHTAYPYYNDDQPVWVLAKSA